MKYWIAASEENKLIFKSIQKIWESETSSNAIKLNARREEIWSAASRKKTSLRRRGSPAKSVLWAAVLTFFLIFSVIAFYYRANDEPPLVKTISWLKKENPAGQRSTHLLPDGTRVWLNAMSSLEYPEVFSDSIRRVKVTGEAYFDVTSNPIKPFIAEVMGIHVEALGTAFNVKNFSNESTRAVSLLEGRVRVSGFDKDQSYILDPGYEILMEKNTVDFQVQVIDFDASFGWKEGILMFNGDDFVTFKRSIERWFGVTMKVSGDPPTDWNIRAKYYNESLKNILRDISFNKNLDFEMVNKDLILKF
ncbi:FecR family protein [Cyclobacterium salsum]|uniref:FecR family protein n=1 Tax=Cyclobacterium salsum TaxID=2666329 RepID=UPI0013917A4B|nr:FecR family protein [Cyclobacterium salsum]